MCRNIKTLFNFEPPATEDEIHASALQFVRKLSGFNKPSQANEAAFDRAIGARSRRRRQRSARACASADRPESLRVLPSALS
jgi:hypothetical protein